MAKHLLFLSILCTSFVFGQTAEVLLYEHSEFRGAYLPFNADSSCRNLPSDWNDRASSADTQGNCVILYEHANCNGKSIQVGPGTPSHNNFVALDFNDLATSIKSCGDDSGPNPLPDPDGDWQTGGLNKHNEYRARHGVPSLVLDPDVSASAQRCADYLAANKIFDHVCGQVFGHHYGENLAGGGFGDAAAAGIQSTEMWYSEEPKHDYNNNNFQYESGHFTQVVWKNTRRLGLGYGVNGDFRVVVGHYDPPGNYQGQFIENVPRPIS